MDFPQFKAIVAPSNKPMLQPSNQRLYPAIFSLTNGQNGDRVCFDVAASGRKQGDEPVFAAVCHLDV